MKRAVRLALLLGLAAQASLAQVPEPDSYRMEAYRGPVPETLQGARVIDTAEAERIWREGNAGFIDVLPRAPKPDNLPEGTIWREHPRMSIPGSIWLPNVGYGEIAEATADYFRRGIETAQAGDPERLLVFFCLDECWMSWNAARRAVEWGMPNVAWFPEGTDIWEFGNLPLEEIRPEEPQP